MNSRERVAAALKGEPVDRPPISFWGHVYHRESSAADLVAHTLERWRAYRWDWVKLNPRRQYHAEPWGVRWRYSGVPDEKPVLAEWPVHAAADWSRVMPLPPDAGALGEHLEAVREARRALPPEVPLLATVFTPLAVLREMVRTPADLRAHLDADPDRVRAALEVVTGVFERYVPMLLAAGADGIFFATVDWATRDQLDEAQYRAWSRPWDLRVLAAARGAAFNVLHVCKRRNLLAALADYPVAAFSWAATEPDNPSLAEGLRLQPGAVMGGIAHDGALAAPVAAPALAQLQQAFDQTRGRRWLAAPGCSIPPTTPPDTLRALREAVERLRPAASPHGA